MKYRRKQAQAQARRIGVAVRGCFAAGMPLSGGFMTLS